MIENPVLVAVYFARNVSKCEEFVRTLMVDIPVDETEENQIFQTIIENESRGSELIKVPAVISVSSKGDLEYALDSLTKDDLEWSVESAENDQPIDFTTAAVIDARNNVAISISGLFYKSPLIVISASSTEKNLSIEVRPMNYIPEPVKLIG